MVVPIFRNSHGKDVRLGRRYEPDPRNDLFPIRALLPRQAYKEPRTWIWDCQTVLDQGIEGSCVGHGFAHEVLSDPYPDLTFTHLNALEIYRLAQQLDEYPGENYDGTSVLAGVKALQRLYSGIESYRWGTSLKDIVATIGYYGSVVIGVNWYEGCYEPGEDGFIRVRGELEGGHCVLLRGVDISKEAFLVHNSWGSSWGDNGTAWLSFSDFERLLSEHGEACVIVHTEWALRVYPK